MGNCSIHSHFEFLDTANALPNPDHKNIPDLLRALKAYRAAGYSHVAVTEHGSFSSYEDLRALSKEAGITVIPAIEGYVQSKLFGPEGQEGKSIEEPTQGESDNLDDDNSDGDNDVKLSKEKDYLYKSSHIILVAKDALGYQSLTEIINHSERNSAKQRMEIPVEVLKEYVKKGHIICTSACISGLFGAPLLEESRKQEDRDKTIALLKRFDFFSLMKKKEEFEALKQRSKTTYKTKQNNARKALELHQGTEDEPRFQAELESWLEVERDTLRAKEELLAREQEFAANEALIKRANKFRCTSKYSELAQYAPMTQEDRDKNREKLQEIWDTFSDIFGDDFYVELQNHQLDKERQIYNTIVSFCEEQKSRGFSPRYIQSNDIHICCKADDPNIDKMIQARNVMKLVRMKMYDEFDPADAEYCIKTEDEISSGLKELQGTYFDLLTGAERESKITDELIEASARNTHILEAISFEPQKADHYPAIENADEEFEQKLAEGIRTRFGGSIDDLPDEYRERILYEKEIMKKMDVIPYHLIVQEFIVFANYYGRIPHNRRAEVESFIHDTNKIIEFVEKNNFPPVLTTGVGRGSACGSLICYCLGITGLDPIEFNLSMERYLNPERVSMPDIDTDLSKDVREATIRHCEKLYGYVCKIGTKTYCAVRSAITKAVDYLAKKHYLEDNIEEVEGIPFSEYKKRWLSIGKTFKTKYLSGNEFAVDVDDLTDEEKELLEQQERADFAQKLVGADLSPEEREICDYYPYAMGQFVQLGQHACGMIISKDRLDNAVPMYYNATKDNWQTQMTYPQAEDLGYLKMDMLGLVTLDICNEIEQQTNDFPDLQTVITAPETYEIMRSGKTEGIFQMNGKRVAVHMRDELKPDCIEDIIGENALNRPGPWDTFHEDYAARKHNKRYVGENSIDTSYSEALTNILEPTYGCLLYQEQVMSIFQQLAGYTMGAADNVRRIMGKKKVDKIAAEKPKFLYGNDGWTFEVQYEDTSGTPQKASLTIMAPTEEEAKREMTKMWKTDRFASYIPNIASLKEIHRTEAYVPGCLRNGIPEQKASELFDIMAEFAKYAFNKSHAAAYAVLACRTAYHKAKHLPIFYSATMNYQEDPDKAKNILKEIISSGVTIIPPRMSNFTYRFLGDENKNTMMFGLKGIHGFGDGMSNVEIRTARNLYEFCEYNKAIPKDNMESLIKIGFFDDWGFTRKALLNALPKCLKEVSSTTESKEGVDFYEEFIYPLLKDNLSKDQTIEEAFETLQWENEFMGIGLNVGASIRSLASFKNTKPYDGTDTWCNFAVVSCSKQKTTKKGKAYYEAVLSDVKGNFITRRFSQPITAVCVRAYVTSEDHKYFITDNERYQTEPLRKNRFNWNEAGSSNIPSVLFKKFPTDTHTEEIFSDASGVAHYIRKSVFERLKREGLVYDADFKKIYEAASAKA